jgi:putative ATP-binding cassette transporter
MNESKEREKQKVGDATILEPGLISQFRAMAHLLLVSPQRNAIVWLALGLAVVVGATAYGQIELNAWNQPFYDAINRKDLSGVGRQLGVYGVIAGALLVLNVAQAWLNQMMKLKLREGLTRDLFAHWLAPKRAFMLASAGEIGVNPDQRIHEDARHLTELSTDLGIGLFQALLLFVSFAGVLWTLSENVILPFDGKDVVIPGYMFWSALLYAGIASLISWRVGRPLVRINAERYARESDLRFALVDVNEHSEAIAVYRGEAREEAKLLSEFERLLAVVRKLVSATTRLTWVTAGYGWFTIIAPILVATPAYFGGNLTFGGLLMAAGAFTQVQQSLRWFVDNAGPIADWQATLTRVAAFREALLDMDGVQGGIGRIALESSAEETLALDNVKVFSPAGASVLSEAHVDIAPGQHVLIAGAPGCGKTSLFRALAGVWPWGAGQISLPLGSISYVPKRPYIPDGSLRDALGYPDPSSKYSNQEFISALEQLGLTQLVPSLDVVARWDHELTAPEQQALAFARLFLHKPRWVIIDAALETLAPEARRTFIANFQKELPDSALISISDVSAMGDFFRRVVNLKLDVSGQRLARPV